MRTHARPLTQSEKERQRGRKTYKRDTHLDAAAGGVHDEVGGESGQALDEAQEEIGVDDGGKRDRERGADTARKGSKKDVWSTLGLRDYLHGL